MDQKQLLHDIEQGLAVLELQILELEPELYELVGGGTAIIITD
jgi:hypothetical protein